MRIAVRMKIVRSAPASNISRMNGATSANSTAATPRRHLRVRSVRGEWFIEHGHLGGVDQLVLTSRCHGHWGQIGLGISEGVLHDLTGGTRSRCSPGAGSERGKAGVVCFRDLQAAGDQETAGRVYEDAENRAVAIGWRWRDAGHYLGAGRAKTTRCTGAGIERRLDQQLPTGFHCQQKQRDEYEADNGELDRGCASAAARDHFPSTLSPA